MGVKVWVRAVDGGLTYGCVGEGQISFYLDARQRVTPVEPCLEVRSMEIYTKDRHVDIWVRVKPVDVICRVSVCLGPVSVWVLV